MKRLFTEISQTEKSRILEMHFGKTPSKKITEMFDAESPSEKIEKIIEKPKTENFFDRMVDDLSARQVSELTQILQDLNIDSQTSADEIHDKIEEKVSENPIEVEMDEAEKQDDKQQKIANTLNAIGASNIAAWAGVPSAIAIGLGVGSVATGFAISWGVTALLMGLAKALDRSGKL